MTDVIMPMLFEQIPPPHERLTAVRFADVMQPLLAQCHGLANTLAIAANHPDGQADDLGPALEILEQYTDCALALFLRWRDTTRTPPCTQEDTHAQAH
jgi:hypothetical protein